ncbi:hypothetical protein [Rossellomorea sp. BNER]|uniref:hypothetical protein n=1 Tax=Rossellomorea sp. BNER TaxID=2962031 RepID=UPI003AF2E1FE|nr:hypothetical protein [Rossellomorea sp. BNER]
MKIEMGFPSILGMFGSLMGLYIWKDYIPALGEEKPDWIKILRLYYIVFLFIPGCLALVASIYKKSYLMFLAFLISLPVTKYIGVKPFIFPDTQPLVYYPLLCYLISFLMMVRRNHFENEQWKKQ